MNAYAHLGDHVGASDVCMVCRNALADFTATGGQWCEGCGPKGPKFDAAWAIHTSGQMPLADAFDLAAGIQCLDGEWQLNANPDGALAAMFTLGDDIFELQSTNYEAWFARLGAYNRLREALEAIYPTACGSVTDPWTFDTYSDLYKDDYGFRPSGRTTGKEMREWIASRSHRQRMTWDD